MDLSAASASKVSTVRSKDKLRVELLTKFNKIDNLETENVITEKMMKEELMLEEKLKADERAEKRNLMEAEKQIEEEKCYKRLNLLLSRSSIYAKFMAEKLKKHEELMQKKKDAKKNSDKKVVDSASRGKKRKALESPVKKKFKFDVNIMDVLKKENIAKQVTEELPNEDSPLYVPPTSDANVSELQPELMTGGIMRPYQYDGYEWMKTLFENGVNGILADEMGLGKTIQCIAFIAHLIEMGVPGPFFICGPLSTVPNWCLEFARFTPDIPVILYHGDQLEREALRKKINKKVKVRDSYCCPVVVTSYSIVLNDVAFLRNIAWKMLVIDEAHRIKNFQCKLIKALKTYNATHRLLLTGTPLQNDLSELWSLLNFILPEIFDDLKVFQSWFDVHRLTQKGVTQEILAKEQEKQIVSTIHQILTPFLLRRTKSDVKLDIPNKKEVIVECPFSSLQQKYYAAVLKRSIDKLVQKEGKHTLDFVYDESKNSKRVSKQANYFGVNEEDELSDIVSKKMCSSDDNLDFSEIKLNTRNISMCLRRICCHPYMVKYPLDPATEDYLVDKNIVRHSGKIQVLDVLLAELKKRGHKVLLFSQFVSMIEILQDYCTYRGYQYTRLIGKMSLPERQEEIKQFHEDPETFIFLISTRAGGLGINLIAADTVILYDSDWNPQGDLQAQDRCHRIGQTKPVVVYRLLVRNTVDEIVFERAVAKRKLEKVIIQKGRFASSKNTLTAVQPAISKEELIELLEACEVNGFVKTDPKNVLSSEELERLLDRSDLMSEAKPSITEESVTDE